MVISMNRRGHRIEYIENQWIYTDNKLPTDTKRPCLRCGNQPSEKDHDYCIANLPGVKNACCGHGYDEGYISFENGVTIRGIFRVERNI